MIIGNPNGEIFLIIEKVLFDGMDNDRYPNGIFNFVIKNEFYPGGFYMADLFNSIRIMKLNTVAAYENGGLHDLKDFSLSGFDFNCVYGLVETEEDYFERNYELLRKHFREITGIAEISSIMRSSMLLGFCGEEEVIIFTRDLYRTFDKIIMPKGYMLGLINSIPDSDFLGVEVPFDDVYQTVCLDCSNLIVDE